MFEVTVIKSFSAAHTLVETSGIREKVHGHNFKVEVTVAASSLNASGLCMDFRDLKNYVNGILGKMDHRLLNDLDFLNGRNPSAENIAHYIGNEMAQKLQGTSVKLSRVKVWESRDSWISYTPD